MIETLITVVLSDAVFGFLIWLIFFKQNRKLKNNEVESSDADIESKKIENDDKQLDLGTKYLEKIMAIGDMLDQYRNQAGVNWEQYHKDMQEVKTAIKEIKEEQLLQNKFLNGEYATFKQHLLETKTADNDKKQVKTCKSKKQKKDVENN